MTSIPRLTIGTRGSPLALAQAHQVRDLLAASHQDLATPDAIAVTIIKTTGDVVLDRALSEIGGKGLFTKEIDEAQLDGRIDLAVHSLKDVATHLPSGLALPCILPREDPRDALIVSPDGATPGVTLAQLPPGAVVGTASLRRRAQVLAYRPDLRIEILRGNVQTRLRKLREGEVDATLLALAGLNRLGMAHVAASVIETEILLPAVAQGAIGVTCRADDSRAQDYLAPLHDRRTACQVTAERALLATLDGSCRTPIAALANRQGEKLRLRGLVARPDGGQVWQQTAEADQSDAEGLGQRLGQALRAEIGEATLAQLVT